MSLPRAVIEAEQKADELLKAMTQPPQEAPTEVTPPTETPAVSYTHLRAHET